jgi:hypothetical protein
MPEITDPHDRFLHELADLLFVERVPADETLPKLAEVRNEQPEPESEKSATGLTRESAGAKTSQG